MELTTREIMEQFRLSKGQVDNLTRRHGKKWSLRRDETGNYLWSDQALEKLEKHLGKKSSRQTAASLPAVQEQMEAVKNMGMALLELKKFLEKSQSENQILRAELSELKNIVVSQGDTLRCLKSEMETRVMVRAEDHANKVEKLLSERLDRQKQKEGILGTIWGKLNVPIFGDRRKLN